MKNIVFIIKSAIVIFSIAVLSLIAVNVEVVGKSIHWEANGFPQNQWSHMDETHWDFDGNLYNGVQNGNFDCILVLGASVKAGGKLSKVLSYRCEAAAEAYFLGASNKLILSGDHGKKYYDEVSAMKKYFLDIGIPPEDIYLDHAGFSTYDSIVRAKEIFGAKKLLVVTQEFHVYRALYIARKIGIEAYGYRAQMPSTLGFRVNNESREFLARGKDWLMVNFLKPNPKYLGDKIDLNQPGTLTHDD